MIQSYDESVRNNRHRAECAEAAENDQQVGGLGQSSQETFHASRASPTLENRSHAYGEQVSEPLACNSYSGLQQNYGDRIETYCRLSAHAAAHIPLKDYRSSWEIDEMNLPFAASEAVVSMRLNSARRL